MTDGDFFDETRDQSVVKSAIVSKYFRAWAQVVVRSTKEWAHKAGVEPRIAYVDLFAGPGRYGDGTLSTPLLVLQTALESPDLRQMLVAVFNDRSAQYAESLKAEISRLPGIERLRFKPSVLNHEVASGFTKMFASNRNVPTLLFADPWGYKGLSLELVRSVLKDWGSECVFFFNYNRVNMGLPNPLVDEHMGALFGNHLDSLRQRITPLSGYARELAIVDELSQALKDIGGTYVLPFCFRRVTDTRTSHYLVFVTKHFQGYEIMKDIMATQSSRADEGVPSFMYSPADERYPILFELSRPLEQLQGMLLQEYRGKSRSMESIYRSHSVGRRFIKRNYKEVLRRMEEAGVIKVNPPASRRKRGTFGDNVIVTFPE